jgi:hypothetical protein
MHLHHSEEGKGSLRIPDIVRRECKEGER